MRLRWRVSTLILAILSPPWRADPYEYAWIADNRPGQFLVKSTDREEVVDPAKVRFVDLSGRPMKPETLKRQLLVRVKRRWGRVVAVQVQLP